MNQIQIEEIQEVRQKEQYYNEKYLKLEKLGYGAFGAVFKVQDKQTGNIYAMKKFYMDNVN